MNAWEKMAALAQKTLAARIKEYDVPELPYLPSDKVVLVYRLPPPPKIEKTDGGLFVPVPGRDYEMKDGSVKSSVIPDMRVKPMGVLLAAGLTALDWLESHGYQLGDIVAFGHYAGHEQDFQSLESSVFKADKDFKQILQLNMEDLKGSKDAIERVLGKNPTLKIVRTETADGVLHVYQPIEREGKK